MGMAGAAVLAAAGVGLSLAPAAWQPPKLSEAGRSVFEAVARAVLEGSLPLEAAPRQMALEGHLQRVEQTLAGFPKPVQDEVDLLLRLLASPPGRLGLAGLASPWSTAPVPDVQAALQQLRVSSLDLRRQTYQALRDITYAAYFADRSTWTALGYSGPLEV